MKTSLFFAVILFTLILSLPAGVNACTNLLVTKGASEDGSVMITYTCDGEFHPHLEYIPARDHDPQDSVEITDWYGNLRGKVHGVEHTYKVVGLMNEHQLAISETTFSGRLELRDSLGLLHYWDLMILALQRSRTAREAIMVMTDFVDQYGYRSTGESFSIADTEEAWIMEMIGMGPVGKRAVWSPVKSPMAIYPVTPTRPGSVKSSGTIQKTASIRPMSRPSRSKKDTTIPIQGNRFYSTKPTAPRLPRTGATLQPGSGASSAVRPPLRISPRTTIARSKAPNPTRSGSNRTRRFRWPVYSS